MSHRHIHHSMCHRYACHSMKVTSIIPTIKWNEEASPDEKLDWSLEEFRGFLGKLWRYSFFFLQQVATISSFNFFVTLWGAQSFLLALSSRITSGVAWGTTWGHVSIVWTSSGLFASAENQPHSKDRVQSSQKKQVLNKTPQFWEWIHQGIQQGNFQNQHWLVTGVTRLTNGSKTQKIPWLKRKLLFLMLNMSEFSILEL